MLVTRAPCSPGTNNQLAFVSLIHHHPTRSFVCLYLFYRDGKAIRLSTDDKPSNPDEELRIRNLGGFVVVGSEISRVNGTLAVSRSIGDFYMVSLLPSIFFFSFVCMYYLANFQLASLCYF